MERHISLEVSPRGGGNRLAEMIRYATGMDLIESAVKAAVGDSVIGLEQKKYDGYWAEYVLHSFENGKFKELYIEPQIRENNLKELDLWVNPGDEVHTFTAANYAIGTVVLKFNSKDEMETIMRSMNEKIKVIVEEDK